MRTYQHIIDTKAVRQVINSIPEHCVVRELTERDYGIDLMIELFDEVGTNEHGHPQYDSTGYLCYLQIKGTNEELKIDQEKEVLSYNISKKALYYVERFSTPFLLVRVCTLKGKEAIYFIWLQRYISDVLDMEHETWRSEDAESLTIRIPIHNRLPENFEKIERISWRIKYIEELAEFHEKYSEILLAYKPILKYTDQWTYYDKIITELKRLTQLTTLLSKNNCCIDQDSILELIDYIKGVQDGSFSPKSTEDFPHYFNLDLLRTSNMSTKFIEEFEAENEGVTVY